MPDHIATIASPRPLAKRAGAGTPARAALGADVATACAGRLVRVSGTHGLLLDGSACVPVPVVDGLARWTVLRREDGVEGWCGPVRADARSLPFADDSCCAVVGCFIGAADPELAQELARVLAPHGSLLMAGLQPRTLWRGGHASGPWARVLRSAGLDVLPVRRCGAPWPRPRGAAGIPRWLVRWLGGAWLLEARRSVLTALPLRRQAARRAVEAGTLVPGAHRECA